MTNRLALTAALLLTTSGCSLALMDKPRSDKGVAVSTSCSDTKAYWLLDAVGVALGVASIGVGMYLSNVESQAKAGNTIAGVGGLVGIGYTASMGNGMRWSRECREVRAGASAAVTAGR